MIIQMNPKCTFYNWCYIILNHHRKGGGFMRQNKYNDINIQLDKINQEVITWIIKVISLFLRIS